MPHASLNEIHRVLIEGLAPVALAVEDESAAHAGHAGAAGRADGGVTHVRVRIISPLFAGRGRVDRHRMVTALLAGELDRGLHAIAIEARAPGE